MTTNQTINGVPRELLQNLLHCGDTASTITPYVTARIREFLDTDKVNNRQMGLMQYVEAHPIKPASQRQCEPVAILSGPDDSVCWTQDSKPKELRKQVVLIEHADLLRLQELSYGAAGMVYQTRWNRLGEWEEWKTVSLDQYKRSEGRLFERRIVYAEQPAPVALVMPERLPGDDGVCTESHYASGWNACLDELKRLNPSL